MLYRYYVGMRGIVVSPTFNEAEGIQQHLLQILTASDSLDVLVVDDNSPDGTANIVSNLSINHPRIFLLNRGDKNGLGQAYLAGFNWCIERDYDFIIQMDADGSHPYSSLPTLIKEIVVNDVVIGSRYIPGGTLVNWPKSRERISKIGNLLARRLIKASVLDVTGGFKAIKVKNLRTLDFSTFKVQGYAFQIDLLRRLSRENLQILEIPIAFTERRTGKSKMNTGIILEAVMMLIVWYVKDFADIWKLSGRSPR